MGDPELPTADGQMTFTLTIPLGGDGSNPVTLQADLGVSINPTVGISRDAHGRFHFHVGANDFVTDDLSRDVREWYLNLNRRASSHRGMRVRMASCATLASMTWPSYETTRRMWFSPDFSLNGDIWPYLPQNVFEAVQLRCNAARAAHP